MNRAISGGILIDGRAAAARVLKTVESNVAHLNEIGLEPGLAVILVGLDPASNVYVRSKVARANEAGIRSFEYRLPADTSESQLLGLIGELNANETVNGLLIQLPLPAHINENKIIQAVHPLKDVDGFHSLNVGGLSQGLDVLTPCTPAGCLYLLQETLGDLTGKHAVIIGRSNIVGKPMAALLLQANCTVSIVHSRTKDPEQLCKQADIVIVAIGRPEFVDDTWLKPGAVVIDVGINRVDGESGSRLVGDVAFEKARSIAGAITPVPGGVGPMTIAYLMKNTITATCLQNPAKTAGLLHTGAIK